MHALCPPFSALCLMSLALCGPLRFYLLFVSDIWCVSVPSCVICCNNCVHSCNLPCAQCMPFALCPPLSALCVVLWGGAFALPRRLCVCSYVLLLCSLCCLLLPLLQYVALCCHLTTCEGLVCVCLFIRTKMAKCAPMCSIDFFDTYSWDKVQCPCTAQHCVCETVLGGSAKFWM